MRSLETHAASAYLLALSNEQAIHQTASSRYLVSYRALTSLARFSEDDRESNGAIGLACAVYGWMPTIMHSYEADNFKTDKPLAAIKGIRTKSSAHSFISHMHNIAPVNSSWVGTSKFLHFLNPEIFPIWDKRVANKFDLNWHSIINRKNLYTDYLEFVHQEIQKEHFWLSSIAEHIEKNHGYTPSKVRCVEMMLFHRG